MLGGKHKPLISSPQEVRHEIHIDTNLNWTFDPNIDPNTIFVKIRQIGKGGFGTVWQIMHAPSKTMLAGKLIDQNLMDSQVLDSLQHEIELMRQIQSPYTVRYFGCVPFDSSLMILMEFCDRGSLRDLLDTRQEVLSEAQVSIIIRDLLLAIDALHTRYRLIHRDIKAANILLNSDSSIKIADFGVSRKFDTGISCQTMTIIGTPYWMAPEVISGTKYSFPADIWSVGITAVELAEGAPPYAELSPTNAMVKIAKDGFPGIRYPAMHSDDFLDFVMRCVAFEPQKRATIKQLLEHPFLKRAAMIPRHIFFDDLLNQPIMHIVDDSSNYEEEEEETEFSQSQSQSNSNSASVSKSVFNSISQTQSAQSHSKKKKTKSKLHSHLNSKIRIGSNGFDDSKNIEVDLPSTDIKEKLNSINSIFMKSINFELVSSLPLFGSSFDDDITSFPRDSTSSKDYIEEPNQSIPIPQVKLPPTPMSGVVLDSVNPIDSVPLPSTDSSLFLSNSESIKGTSDMKYVEVKASEMEFLSITTKTVKPNSVKLDKEERARISAQVTDYLEQTRILAGRVPFATIGGRRREGEQPEGEDAPCTYTLPPRPGAKPGAGRKARAQGKDGGSREKERSRKQRREYDPVVVAVVAAFLAAITLLFVRSDGLIAVALILAALFVGYRLSRTNE